MKNWKFQIALIGLLGYLLIGLFLPKANAQGFSLSIDPPILQIDATAPSKIKSYVTLTNLSYEEISLDIGLKPFTSSPNQNGEVKYVSDSDANFADPLIFQRIRIEDENGALQSLTLAPKQQKKITLNIDLPKGEPPSDYYFSVIFISKEVSQDNLSSSQNLGGIAANVLLSIGPKDTTRGFLEEFSAPFFLEKGPVPFTVKIKNESNHFIVPQGEILIQNMFGQTIGKVDLLPVNILSKTTRLIPDSLQSPEVTTKALWHENFLLGLYTAKLTVNLSDKGPLFSKTIYFFAFPLEMIILTLIIIFISIIFISRLKKRLNEN